MQTPPRFVLVGWSALTTLFPLIEISFPSFAVEESRYVSETHIKSQW